MLIVIRTMMRKYRVPQKHIEGHLTEFGIREGEKVLTELILKGVFSIGE